MTLVTLVITVLARDFNVIEVNKNLGIFKKYILCFLTSVPTVLCNIITSSIMITRTQKKGL